MSYNVEAHGNQAGRQANQAVANQNSNSSSFLVCSKSTALIVVIGTAIIVGIVLGVTIGVTQHEKRWVFSRANPASCQLKRIVCWLFWNWQVIGLISGGRYTSFVSSCGDIALQHRSQSIAYMATHEAEPVVEVLGILYLISPSIFAPLQSHHFH